MLISTAPAKVFPNPEAAQKAIDALCDPDWSYKIVLDPEGSGKAIVKIYDEENHFVADLNF